MESKVFKFKDKIIELFKKGCSQAEVSKYIKKNIGLKRTQCNFWAKKLNPDKTSSAQDNPSIPKDTKLNKLYSFSESGDGAVIEKITSERVKTLEDLVRVCEIDTKIWRIDRYEVNAYESHTRLRHYVFDGGRTDDEHKVVQLFQVKCYLVRNKENILKEDLLKNFSERAEIFAPKKFIFQKQPKSADCLYVLNMAQDLHMGKLAHGLQTGWGDYDLKIAQEVYWNALNDLISSAPINRIKKILLICGSDQIHYENEKIETTSGTKIDGDSRWHKVFNEACDLIVKTVEKLASQFEVEVMVIRGNHASLSEYALGAYVKAFFRNHPQVNVNNDPADRKYFGFGKTLIGFVHDGGVIKKKNGDLALVMLREKQEEISNFKHLFWLTGHIHRETIYDVKGIRIMVSPALCPPDKWHSDKNYVGNIRASQGMLFSPDDGLLQINYSKSL